MRRMTIDFAEEEVRKLEEIKKYLGASFDKEAIRRSIGLAYELSAHLKRGDAIYIKSAGGEMREIKFC